MTNQNRVAILGAGFCGLAIAWYLLHSKRPPAHLAVFDAKGIGGGASGIAAGLLHPFAGAHAKLNPQGFEGMAATQKLLHAVSKIIGKELILSKRVIRPALTEKQQKDFFHSAEMHDEIKKLSSEKVQSLIPGVAHVPAVLIEEGMTIDCSLYLQGLFEGCQQKGAVLYKQKINSIEEIGSEYDQIIICLGGYTKTISELANLPITPIKGQIFELTWPNDTPPLSFAVSSHAYICMNRDLKSCVAGSTFERDFISEEVDIEQAKRLLMPKIESLFPALSKAPILSCKAALRASAPKHAPLLISIPHPSKSIYLLSGMGSKGLLYHALYAQKLVDLFFH